MTQLMPLNANHEVTTAVNKKDLDTQISIAKQYPRDISKALNLAYDLATKNEEIAASCFYSLPRGGSNGEKDYIKGPSIRLAEIILYCWGNIRAGARIVKDDGKFITAQAVVIDLESNVEIVEEVQRKVTNRDGRRYSDDMIMTTSNAAASIALRNAIFRVIPAALYEDIYNSAIKTAVGDEKTLVQKRQNALSYFTKLGVSQEKLLALLEKKTLTDISLKDLENLNGIATAIKDKMMTVDEIFNVATESGSDKIGQIKNKIANKQKEGS